MSAQQNKCIFDPNAEGIFSNVGALIAAEDAMELTAAFIKGHAAA